MKDFKDRVSSGKKIITYEDGTTEAVTIENAEDATVEGTPINRENLMAIQGFIGEDIICIDENTFMITNSKGEVTNIKYNNDGSITEEFVGEKTITSTLTFPGDGTMRRVIS